MHDATPPPSDPLTEPTPEEYAHLSQAFLESTPSKDSRAWNPAKASDIGADIDAASFRHRFWKHRREATFEALTKTGATDRVLHRFQSCGRNGFVYRAKDDPEKFRVQCDRCRNRWCEACANERRLIMRRNLEAKLPSGRVRFATLTVKSNPDLKTCVDHLIGSFRKLREKQYYKQHLVGGIWFLEVTRRESDGAWHPHLHILYTGEYIAKEKLSLDWHKITLDSYIVDLRQIKNKEHACGYVTKYATKAIAPNIWRNPDVMAEMINALGNQKLVATFGSWRGMKLCAKIESDTEWACVGPLWKITLAAAGGDPEACAIIRRIGKYVEHHDDHPNAEDFDCDTG